MPKAPSKRADWTRRDFMSGVLASGFALAVRPVGAQTIITDSKGIVDSAIELSSVDRPIPAYYAMPELGEPFPLVLVVQEIFGVHEHIRDVCRRLAKAGYFAIAPELFVRQGDVSGMTDIPQILREVVSKVPDPQVMADLDAAVAWAVGTGWGDINRLAVTGFCWGGRIAWLYSSYNSRVKAGVAWYGRLVGQADALTPRHPIDVAATLKVPVLGLYGEADTGIPLDTVEQMRTALAKGTSGSQIVVYPDAPHAFFADYRPSYRRETADDGWKRMLQWFRKHGVDKPGVVGAR